MDSYEEAERKSQIFVDRISKRRANKKIEAGFQLKYLLSADFSNDKDFSIPVIIHHKQNNRNF